MASAAPRTISSDQRIRKDPAALVPLPNLLDYDKERSGFDWAEAGADQHYVPVEVDLHLAKLFDPEAAGVSMRLANVPRRQSKHPTR